MTLLGQTHHEAVLPGASHFRRFCFYNFFSSLPVFFLLGFQSRRNDALQKIGLPLSSLAFTAAPVLFGPEPPDMTSTGVYPSGLSDRRQQPPALWNVRVAQPEVGDTGPRRAAPTRSQRRTLKSPCRPATAVLPERKDVLRGEVALCRPRTEPCDPVDSGHSVVNKSIVEGEEHLIKVLVLLCSPRTIIVGVLDRIDG